MSTIDLAAVRKSLDLTQRQAAEIVQVEAATWQQWETKKRKMRDTYWELFCLKTGYTEASKHSAPFSKLTNKQINDGTDTFSDLTHMSAQRNSVNKKYTFIDLFAGIGGIKKAFQTSNSSCIYSSEIDPFARQTYYANYGLVPYGDICTLDHGKIPKHDILCAGFPCQPFSHIGKREGFAHPTQGTMFDEILQIVDKTQPRVIFLENVPGITNHDKGRTLRIILDALRDRKYHCKYEILNASEFGIPQMRKRFYLVCFKEKVDFKFPTPPLDVSNIGDFIEEDVRGYSISKHLQGTYLYKVNDGRPNVINKYTKGSIKTLVSTYHKIQRLTGTFVSDGETGLRLLTENECKAIMGFPKNFYFPVSRTQMYRQMGNAVVIKVVKEIAKEIYKSLNKL